MRVWVSGRFSLRSDSKKVLNGRKSLRVDLRNVLNHLNEIWTRECGVAIGWRNRVSSGVDLVRRISWFDSSGRSRGESHLNPRVGWCKIESSS
jgi:hypothetical protein